MVAFAGWRFPFTMRYSSVAFPLFLVGSSSASLYEDVDQQSPLACGRREISIRHQRGDFDHLHSSQDRSLLLRFESGHRAHAFCFGGRCSSVSYLQKTYRDVPVQSLRSLLENAIRHATCPSPCRASGPCFGILCLSERTRPIIRVIATEPSAACMGPDDYPLSIHSKLVCMSGWGCAPLAYGVALGPSLSGPLPAVLLTAIPDGPSRGGPDLHRRTRCWRRCVGFPALARLPALSCRRYAAERNWYSRQDSNLRRCRCVRPMPWAAWRREHETGVPGEIGARAARAEISTERDLKPPPLPLGDRHTHDLPQAARLVPAPRFELGLARV